MQKQTYTTPALTVYGDVAGLTLQLPPGKTVNGPDAFGRRGGGGGNTGS